jgi:hypothetical protein
MYSPRAIAAGSVDISGLPTEGRPKTQYSKPSATTATTAKGIVFLFIDGFLIVG